MEWVTSKINVGSGGIQHLKVGNVDISVWSFGTRVGWDYSVTLFNEDYPIAEGNTDTEERAKRFAIYEAHRIIRDLVNDLAEITGENYHLELN